VIEGNHKYYRYWIKRKNDTGYWIKTKNDTGYWIKTENNAGRIIYFLLIWPFSTDLINRLIFLPNISSSL
jgi:hypothetical protein